MLLLYVFIVLLILLTLLSAFGGSIRTAPAPAVRFEKFTDEEKEDLEEFVASEPFRRGLYGPAPSPMMTMEPQIFRPMSASSPSMSMPMMAGSSPSMSMPMMAGSSPSMAAPSMEMYEEIERDGGAIEPFEQNDVLQASY